MAKTGAISMKYTRQKLAFSLVCMIFGVILAVQLRTVISVVGINVLPNQKISKLIEENNTLEEKKANSMSQLESIVAEIDEIRKYDIGQDEGAEELYRELDKYEALAGYKSVSGPAINVEVSDPELNRTDNLSSIVQNYNYILQIITILNDNGAEAVAINGQRFTNYTELIPQGKSLKVDNVEIIPPITVSAIGDVESMERALNIKGNTVWSMKNRSGYGIRILRIEDLTIRKIPKNADFEYANPV